MLQSWPAYWEERTRGYNHTVVAWMDTYLLLLGTQESRTDNPAPLPLCFSSLPTSSNCCFSVLQTNRKSGEDLLVYLKSLCNHSFCLPWSRNGPFPSFFLLPNSLLFTRPPYSSSCCLQLAEHKRRRKETPFDAVERRKGGK